MPKLLVMQPRNKTSRSRARPEPGSAAPGVLLVGQAPGALQALAVQVQAALPRARIELLATTTELVFRLANEDAAIVILDGAHLDETPPSLLSLSRGASSPVRLAFVGGSEASPHTITAEALPAWLRSARVKALT